MRVELRCDSSDRKTFGGKTTVFIDQDEATRSNKVSQRLVAIGITSAFDLYSAVHVSGSVWSIKVFADTRWNRTYVC